jgi:hypothetical protein
VTVPAGETPPQPPRPIVSARDVLHAISEIRRRGQWPLFQDLEAAEPDLAEFVLEEITAIHHTLLKTGARPKAVRRFQRQVQNLALVCVLTLRRSDRGDADHPLPPPAEQEIP